MKIQSKPDYFFNRELSWIEFNRRVLNLAKDLSVPILERVKFLSIFSTNLDEFFMIRVSGLKRQAVNDVKELTTDGMSTMDQKQRIHEILDPMVTELYQTFNEEVFPELSANGISILSYDQLNEIETEKISRYFDAELFPILTPLAVDNVHPFPNINNRSLALIIILEDPDIEVNENKFCILQIPNNVERFYKIEREEGMNFIPVEEIVKANAEKLFPGMNALASFKFRITRNADLELEEDEASDLLRLIEEEVKKRRLGIVVRLEVDSDMPERLTQMLMKVLKLDDTEVYKITGLLDLGSLMELYKIDSRKLKYEPFTPRISSYLRSKDDIFNEISQQDILLHHPFYSFSSVTEYIAQAAEDPNVYAIKLTLYRTSGDSTIIKSLITAAENGKQVTAIVELKARFDEENNIIWARELEKAGVHVVYGLIGLKTHCKVALVVRKEPGGMKRYLHLGTGNYNHTTAKLYTDLGLFTTNKDFGVDASNLFNFLTGYSKQTNYKKLVVAPINLRRKMMKMIDNEIEMQKNYGNGFIIIKANSIVDSEIIMKLYEASKVGVKIDMLIRGICRVRPGVEGFSENIRVYSIVGRFLEHSRIYYFNNNGDPQIYLGSADWMERNFDRRVEVLFPIEDSNIKDDLFEILNLYLKDTENTTILQSDGSYINKWDSLTSEEKVNTKKLDIHQYFIDKMKSKHEKEVKEEIKQKIKNKELKTFKVAN